MPGAGVEEVVTARADYSELDRPDAPVRIRLMSTALRARNVGDPATAREVEVIYARDGTLHTVRATAAVLACWNCMIPYLCPEMPARQPARRPAFAGQDAACLHYGRPSELARLQGARRRQDLLARLL